jgi:glycosyltransferase involved in cell wall biosynthesis
MIRIGVLDHTGSSLGGGTLVAAHLAALLSGSYSVELIRDWSGFTLPDLSRAFSLDLDKVQARSFGGIWKSFAVPGGTDSFREKVERSRQLTAPYDVFICAGHWVPPFCFAKHGFIYCHFPIEIPADAEELGSKPIWLRRHQIDRWLRTKAYSLAWQTCLRGYEHAFANSAFTAEWMKRRWGVRAEVLYPPVDLHVPQAKKQNRIVSIGRFLDNSPGHKGQFAQISAFREFLARVSQPWELFLIGSCFPPSQRSFVDTLQQAARDLPVRLLVNVDRAIVIQALAAAKLFWHTPGTPDDRRDDPAAAEHFGMATVEAMRARCVPIVLNSGGQKEIVQDGVNGFLCSDMDQVVQNTFALVNDEPRLQSLAAAAEQRSMLFTAGAFDARILKVVAQTLSLPPKHFIDRAALNLLAQSRTTPEAA